MLIGGVRCQPQPAPITPSGPPVCFEGHGVATELLRVYQETHRDRALTMRAALIFSPNWDAVWDRARSNHSSRHGAAGLAGPASATIGSR